MMKILNFKSGSKGFTLIELLVVISIIGVLATLILVSFTTSQRQARDTQRKSDLAQYRSALENYANTSNGLYPSHTSRTDLAKSGNTLCNDLILTGCPTDPSDPTNLYEYISNGGNLGINPPSATKYILWAKLENSSNYWVVCSNGKSLTAPTAGWTDPNIVPPNNSSPCGF